MNKSYDYRILIVDDNTAIHEDFKKILTGKSSSAEMVELDKELFGETHLEQNPLPHFQIDTATQYDEAINKMKASIAESHRYSLAFVDVRMPPGPDGIATIKKFWEIDKDIQVVLCTAYSDYTWEETIAHLGQTDNLLILKKPFDNTTVRQLACALSKKWELSQTVRQHTESLKHKIDERTTSLNESLARMHATLESSTDGILVVDTAGRIINFNNKFALLWNLKKSTIDKQNYSSVMKLMLNMLQDSEKFIRKVKEIANHPEAVCVDVIRTKNHSIYEYYSQPQILNDKIIGRVWSFRDITQRAQMEDKLYFQATHDVLTGLPNRTLLQDRLNQAIANATRKQTQFAVLFFDLDRFKLINDSLSHAFGDELLKTVAERLQDSIRAGDTLARLGGDEFVVLINESKDKKTLDEVSNKLLKAISLPYHIFSRELIITTSIGISVFPKDGHTAEVLLTHADSAMYYAKKYGANQIKYFHEKMDEDNLKFLERELELHQAISNNEFFLSYQPQVDIMTESLVAVEALVRWKHPERGILMPNEFIPLAEETGLIIPLGDWILRTACKQNKEWQDAGLPPIRMAVNITNKQLHQYNFIKSMMDILQESKLAPHFLELEITEDTLINHPAIKDTLHAIKELGVRIALDDFGTGYSRLTTLRDVHLDRLNIDRSFVQNIQVIEGDEIILSAIIAMARNLNLEVLAEGVETEMQMEFLKTQRCGEIQGFYYSKALSPKDLEKLLKDKSRINKLIELYK